MKILNLCFGIAWLLGSYPAVGAVADRFDYPIGNRDRYTETNNGDGWYVAQEFGEWNASFSKYHLGEDWNAESGGNTDCGLPVCAVANGTIVYASIVSGWGRVLIVRHTLSDGSQVESLYGHLGSFAKTSGDVARGEQIGTIGDGSEGGTTYACHLHLELRTAGCTNWGQAGPGYSVTSKPVGWADPSDYIDSHRQVLGLNDGLVAYYPFDGNANDASGNGYDGIVNGPVLGADRFGNPNASYSFTGKNNWIRANIGPEFFKPAFTFSVWVKFADFANYYPQIVTGDTYYIHCSGLGPAYPPNLQQKIAFYQQAQPYPEGGSYRQGEMITGSVCETNVWYHLCIVRNDTDFRMYLNGALSAEVIDANRIALSGSYLRFGSNPVDSGEYSSLHGSLDDIRIYNRALSAPEVVELFSIESRTSGPRIIAQPQGQIAQGGSKVDLTVSASGAPPLYYQWRFRGQSIAGATSSALSRTSAAASDSGGYSVVVWNAYGSVTSATASLSVLADGANGTQPVRPYGPTLPLPAPGQDSMVIVTHGWCPTFMYREPPASRPEWATKLYSALQARVPSNWAVEAYDWMRDAWKDTPDQALAAARIRGQELGTRLAGMHLSQLHLIGHSAGAELIDSAARVVRQQWPATTIHCTFLDPFTGVELAGRGYYGKHARWADNYFVHDFVTDSLPTALRRRTGETEGPLDYAYNVDVSAATLGAVELKMYASGGGVTAGSTPAFGSPSPSHDSPCEFYLSTVKGTAPSCAAGYGFGFSQEAGGWERALAQVVHNDPPYGLCGSLTPNQGAAPVVVGPVLPLQGLPNASSAGAVLFFGGGASLSAGGPIKGGTQPKDLGAATWLAVEVTVTNDVNFIQFDAEFTDTNAAEGLLTVYWNTNQIGMLDERVGLVGLQTYRFTLPATVSEGGYTLSFHLDSYTNAATVTVTNVATGFIGLTQPTKLEIVSMGSENGPVLQLTAAAGYNYLVQSSSNLTDWVPTAFLVNTSGAVLFADPGAANASARFYRAVIP